MISFKEGSHFASLHIGTRLQRKSSFLAALLAVSDSGCSCQSEIALLMIQKFNRNINNIEQGSLSTWYDGLINHNGCWLWQLTSSRYGWLRWVVSSAGTDWGCASGNRTKWCRLKRREFLPQQHISNWCFYLCMWVKRENSEKPPKPGWSWWEQPVAFLHGGHHTWVMKRVDCYDHNDDDDDDNVGCRQ